MLSPVLRKRSDVVAIALVLIVALPPAAMVVHAPPVLYSTAYALLFVTVHPASVSGINRQVIPCAGLIRRYRKPIVSTGYATLFMIRFQRRFALVLRQRFGGEFSIERSHSAVSGTSLRSCRAARRLLCLPCHGQGIAPLRATTSDSIAPSASP